MERLEGVASKYPYHTTHPTLLLGWGVGVRRGFCPRTGRREGVNARSDGEKRPSKRVETRH